MKRRYILVEVNTTTMQTDELEKIVLGVLSKKLDVERVADVGDLIEDDYEYWMK